jgi:ClpP class serine protease
LSAFSYLAERLLDRPLLATPAHAATVVGVLADRLAVASIALGGEMLDPAAVRAGVRDVTRSRAGYVVDAGVAFIPIVGSLVSRGSSIAPQSGLTAYTSVGEALDAAMADRAVRGVILDIDSPGGEAAGCFDLARRIRAANAVKPVWAVVDEEANSGGYALASGAGRILVPHSGQLGSVGVVVVHRDRSGQLAREGVRVTLLVGGARKADGHPFARRCRPRWPSASRPRSTTSTASSSGWSPSTGACRPPRSTRPRPTCCSPRPRWSWA